MLKKVFLALSILLLSCIIGVAYATSGRPVQNYIYDETVGSQENSLAQDTVKTENKIVKGVNKLRNNAKINFKKIKKKEKPTLNSVKNAAPKTIEEYEALAKDVSRDDVKVPEPKFEKDEKLAPLPDPLFRVVKYNDPPGGHELNLNDIKMTRRGHSIGVLSPDESKLVYSDVYYYVQQNQISSELFVINTDANLSLVDKLKNSNEVKKNIKPIMQTGTDALQNYTLRTLTVIDWSKDSQKIAFKEKIGSTFEGIWQTNLYVYNFQTGRLKRLNEVREAIKYWWKANKNIDLVDFMWDIVPMGWDANSPDRLIVYAYGYTGAAPKFLGAWSIDSEGNRSELLSLEDASFSISANGYMLKAVIRE